jgi:hypothetical protein
MVVILHLNSDMSMFIFFLYVPAFETKVVVSVIRYGQSISISYVDRSVSIFHRLEKSFDDVTQKQ